MKIKKTMPTEKFPLRLMASDDPHRPFKAATSLDKASDLFHNIGRDLAFLEQDYAATVESARRLNQTIKASAFKDPRLYWRVGDEMVGFLGRLDEMGLYLEGQSETLARDAGMPARSLQKIIAFRRRFPDYSALDAGLPWARYRENKAPSPKKDEASVKRSQK